MNRLILVFIIALFVIFLFAVEYLIEKFDCRKYDKEIKLRQIDILLSQYYNEMNNDRNDGWTKNHYKALYRERLKYIKNKK